MRFDDVEEPRILDELVSLTGAEPLDYQEKRTCCAPGISALSVDDSLAVVKRKVESAGDADCLVLCCPQCFQQFDVGQMMLARKQGLARKLPVINYVQLLGLAFGYSLDDVGYRFHKTRDENFEKKLANAASMAS
jgi:heterodisulfide reductase subunit B